MTASILQALILTKKDPSVNTDVSVPAMMWPKEKLGSKQVDNMERTVQFVREDASIQSSTAMVPWYHHRFYVSQVFEHKSREKDMKGNQK